MSRGTPRPVVVDGERYPSIAAAARALGRSESTVREKIDRRMVRRTRRSSPQIERVIPAPKNITYGAVTEDDLGYVG